MKLSFLITYHNEGPWLAECLQSVLPQLAGDDEVLVYDDASETPAADYLLHDPRVRCIRADHNIGPARARNELLRASRGTHVHFHDADDLCAPDWRARVVAAFTPATHVVLTDVCSFDTSGQQWRHVMDLAAVRGAADLLSLALRGGVLAPAGTYQRALVEQLGGYREELWQSEDYDFHIRLALARPQFRVITEDLVLIRRHERQRSRDTVAVWSCAAASLQHNAARLPADALADAARAATRAASHLFAAGAHADAEHAFRLAERFGGARYERALMQNLTRLVGPLSAEKLAAWYRKLLPRRLRMHVQRSGW